MALDNSLYCGQTDTSAFECLLRMEALENTKQLILILHVKTNSVVFNKYDHLARRVVQRIDFYLGLLAASSEFHCVGNEITEHEPEHGRISVTNRQIPDVPDNLPALRIRRNFADHAFYERFEMNGCLLRFGPADPRERQKIIHQAAHPFG